MGRKEEERKEGKGEQKVAADKIIEAMIDAVGIADLNLRAKDANKAWMKMFGYKKKEIIGMPVLNLYAERDRAVLMERAKEDIEKGISRTSIYTAINKAGKEFPVQTSVSLRKDKKGNPMEFIAVIRDITELKRLDDELRAERNKLQAIIGAMEYGLTIQDQDYNIIYQNEVLEKLFGRLGKKCYRVYEGKDKICDGCPVEMAFKDGKSHTSERKVVMPSGEIAFWENTANPIRDASGEIVTCLEITRNITELKRLQEKEKEAAVTRMAADTIEGMVDVVGMTDMEGRIIQINEAVEAWGYKKEDLIGKPVVEVLAKRSLPNLKEERNKTLKTGVMRNLELIGLRKNGSEFPVLVNVTLMKDAKGKPTGRIFAIRDITELKRLQENDKAAAAENARAEEAEKYSKELEAKVKELEEFHDVAVGRELKMIELEEEIEKLERKLKKGKRGGKKR